MDFFSMMFVMAACSFFNARGISRRIFEVEISFLIYKMDAMPLYGFLKCSVL